MYTCAKFEVVGNFSDFMNIVLHSIREMRFYDPKEYRM